MSETGLVGTRAMTVASLRRLGMNGAVIIVV